MSAESIVAKALQEVSESVAAGVVDMGTGMLLGVKTVDSHPSSVLDMLAGANKELFEGKMIRGIEAAFRKVRGEEGEEPFFQEMIITSKNLLHVMGRLSSNPRVVATVVTRRDVNLGLAVMKFREILATERV